MARVMVGLSGGVDSAVAAALLQSEGHEVIGAFIKIWQPEFLECTWKEDRLSAKKVAAHLGIPFVEFDLSDQYRDVVLKDMIDGYKMGRTPNPDVLCNRYIKFGHLWELAQKMECSHIATGHYAGTRESAGKFELLRGVDPEKDQSYFLWRLTEHDLAHVFFPLGNLTKTQVRTEAKKRGLPNANRPDSQGLCFVGALSLKEFLSHYIETKPGLVVNEQHEPIGVHSGAQTYTIGQRQGFTLEQPNSFENTPGVVAIDVEKNEITVGDVKSIARTTIVCKQTSLVSEQKKLSGEKIEFQIRHRQTPIPGVATTKGVELHVISEQPITCANGQSLVIYKDFQCLGGGVVV